MELMNALAKADDGSPQGRALAQEAWEAIVLLLNAVAPHICHALWQALGHEETLVDAIPFPKADPEALRRSAVTLDRKSTRLNSSHVKTSYAVFWLKKTTPMHRS